MLVLKYAHRFFHTPLIKKCSLIPFPSNVRWPLWLPSNEYINRSDTMWFQKLGPKSHCGFASARSLSLITLWRKPAAMLWGCSSNSMGRLTWQGTEATCQQPCVSVILERDRPAPAKPSDDCNTSQKIACNLIRGPEPQATRLSFSWILTHRNI